MQFNKKPSSKLMESVHQDDKLDNTTLTLNSTHLNNPLVVIPAAKPSIVQNSEAKEDSSYKPINSRTTTNRKKWFKSPTLLCLIFLSLVFTNILMLFLVIQPINIKTIHYNFNVEVDKLQKFTSTEQQNTFDLLSSLNNSNLETLSLKSCNQSFVNLDKFNSGLLSNFNLTSKSSPSTKSINSSYFDSTYYNEALKDVENLTKIYNQKNQNSMKKTFNGVEVIKLKLNYFKACNLIESIDGDKQNTVNLTEICNQNQKIIKNLSEQNKPEKESIDKLQDDLSLCKNTTLVSQNNQENVSKRLERDYNVLSDIKFYDIADLEEVEKSQKKYEETIAEIRNDTTNYYLKKQELNEKFYFMNIVF